jgi:hypothetical protein
VSDNEPRIVPDQPKPGVTEGDAPGVLDLELEALAYEAALRYGARQVPKPLVEFLRPPG